MSVKHALSSLSTSKSLKDRSSEKQRGEEDMGIDLWKRRAGHYSSSALRSIMLDPEKRRISTISSPSCISSPDTQSLQNGSTRAYARTRREESNIDIRTTILHTKYQAQTSRDDNSNRRTSVNPPTTTNKSINHNFSTLQLSTSNPIQTTDPPLPLPLSPLETPSPLPPPTPPHPSADNNPPRDPNSQIPL